MNLHEYRAKQLIARTGVSIPMGNAATSPQGAKDIAENIDAAFWFVKAQILAGNRKAGGGILRANSTDQVEHHAETLLGRRLITNQTHSAGELVSCVYIEQGIVSEREIYLAFLVDQAAQELALLISNRGGCNVEESASAEQVLRLAIPIDGPLEHSTVSQAIDYLDLPTSLHGEFVELLRKLHGAIPKYDATLLELNPIVISNDNRLVALDVKMTVDDNAFFRHPDLLRIKREGDADLRLDRENFGFNYEELDGNIGCIVTGAGLALATIDMLMHAGGRCANFLDLPPVATRGDIEKAYKKVAANPRVKSILVNVVGGGMLHCSTVADGIIAAVRETKSDLPLIARFAGVNADYAHTLLNNANIKCELVKDFKQAVDLSVQAAIA